MKTKKMWNILLVVFVLGLFVVGGGYFAYRAYLSARDSHLIKQARHYLTTPDVKKALLCLQRVLRSNPRNVEACRLMAELREAGRSPDALDLRRRVVEINPRSLDDRLLLARSALIFDEYPLATNALAGVDATGKKTAAYHNLAGEVALTIGALAQAEADFLEAVRLEPTNPVPQLHLALVRLLGTNATALAEARATLTQLSASSSALRCQALRGLVADALRFRQTNVAMQLSSALIQQTNSTFSDQLSRLFVLKISQHAAYQPTLTALEREAATNFSKIYEMSGWQMTRLGPAEALAWLHRLPSSFQTNQPLALMQLVVQCQTMLKDWRGLQNSLKIENWAEVEYERHALLAYALRQQELTAAAKGEWDLALKAANGNKKDLFTLLRLAASWQWDNESEELLWTIVNQYPAEKWAFLALTQTLFFKALHADNSHGRNSPLRPLMQLYSQELKRSPSNLETKNNLAMLALLLDAQELNPHTLAREVYTQAPTNAAFVATYAFSLHFQKKDTEALKVIERLTPTELQDPSIAGYYSLILQATGNKDKARTYLELAFKGQLLPEERKLFERARAGA